MSGLHLLGLSHQMATHPIQSFEIWATSLQAILPVARPAISSIACNAPAFTYMKPAMDTPKNNADWVSLIKGMRDVDAEATKLFFNSLASRARNYFRRNGLSEADSNSLAVTCTTDIYFKVTLPRMNFEGQSFTGWAYSVFRTKLADQFRRQPKLVPLTDADLNRSAPVSFRNGVLDAAESAALEDAKAALRPGERLLVESRQGLEEPPYKILAAEFGESSTTLRVRYKRALKKLKNNLDADPRMQSWINRHP